MPVQKLRLLRDALTTGLVERDVAVRLALLASLAGEHVLMVGPPGTAKSLVARRLHLAFRGSAYFERLLTRFSVPEELFGPLSIKGLEEDRYERLTAGYLPKASIAFLDEIFKANSAILNSLLTLLNEREFDNGNTRQKTPLVAVIGASNELPEGEELDALFDRFLLRVHVGPVSKAGFPALLGLEGQAEPEVGEELKLRAKELEAIRAGAELVTVPADVLSLLCELREWCGAEGIRVSDRRWRKVAKLLRVSAATNGRAHVSIWDCWLLQHCLWDAPETREKVFDWYSARVGASAAMDPTRLTTIVTSWEARLKKDQEERSQLRDFDGKPVFKGLDGKHTTECRDRGQARRGTAVLFLAPAEVETMHRRNGRSWDRTNGGRGFTLAELEPMDVGHHRFSDWSGKDRYLVDQNNWVMEDFELAAVLEPARHKAPYIADCVRETTDLHQQVTAYRQDLAAHIKSLETEIRDHLWVTADFAGPAAQHLDQTCRDVDTLLARVVTLQQGFNGLPRELLPDDKPNPAGAMSPAKRGG